MKNKILVVFAVAVCGVAAGTAETVQARYVRLTVTASRPAPSQPPFYGGRSWQICDWTLLRGGKALGWDGAVIKRAREAKGRDDDGWRAEFIRLVETAQLLRDHPNGPSRSDSPDIAVDPGFDALD